jgi:hypothetical protein
MEDLKIWDEFWERISCGDISTIQINTEQKEVNVLIIIHNFNNKHEIVLINLYNTAEIDKKIEQIYNLSRKYVFYKNLLVLKHYPHDQNFCESICLNNIKYYAKDFGYSILNTSELIVYAPEVIYKKILHDINYINSQLNSDLSRYLYGIIGFQVFSFTKFWLKSHEISDLSKNSLINLGENFTKFYKRCKRCAISAQHVILTDNLCDFCSYL